MSLLNRLKCDRPALQGLKNPCDNGTENYNPICPGINSETPHANEGLCAYPAKLFTKALHITQMAYF